jgi:hypothetical protein
MLLRPKLAGLFAALVSSAALLLTACSSSSPQDMNKGTDVGLGYVPPDVGQTTTEAGAIEAGGGAETGSAVEVSGAADAGVDAAISANAVDGGGQVEASVDASIDGND